MYSFKFTAYNYDKDCEETRQGIINAADYAGAARVLMELVQSEEDLIRIEIQRLTSCHGIIFLDKNTLEKVIIASEDEF